MAFIDSDREFQGNMFEGAIRILSPKDFYTETIDYIIISVQDSADILQQCRKREIDGNKIIDYWKNDNKNDFIDANVKKIYDLERELAKLSCI